MLTRFKLLLLITVVLLATTAIAQSEPAAPSPAPAPEVAAPAAPAPPAAKVAKTAAPATPASPASPVAPKPPVPPEPPRHFQLEYVVKEVDNGKVTNSRSYSVMVAANGEGRRKLRSGSRVPVATGPENAGNTPFSYFDLGVDIDSFDIHEAQGQLWLRISASVESLGPKTEIGKPVIRQNRWESDVTIPVGKMVTVFSSDDVASTRTMQLDLKATPVK